MFRRQRTIGFALGAIALGLGASACDVILGIHDVQPDTTGGSGGGTTSVTTGGGGTGGTSTGGGGATGGTGGSTIDMGDFAFAASSPNAELPISGQAFLGVQISPMNGFVGDVKIDLKLPPSDVTFEGVTLPSGALQGMVKLGAKASATLGQMFDLTLVATSGNLTHEATVHGVVTGTPGTLVDGFGVAGIASWTLAMDAGDVYDVREVAQNKIVTTGDHLPGLSSFLKGSRVLAAGVMDTGFGPNADGVVTAQFCGCSKPSEGRSVFREPGGRVIMIGTGNKGSGFTDDIAILRLKDDGTPDNIGNDAGKALLDLGGVEHTGGAWLMKDGKIAVAADTGGLLAVAVVNSFYDGLDSGFASGAGWLQFPPGSSGSARDIVQEAVSGDLVMVGQSTSAGHNNIQVARLKSNGQPAAFGQSGAREILGSPNYFPTSIAIDTAGRIVVAGATLENGNGDVFVLRLLADGTSDATFGSGGFAVLATNADDNVTDMALLPDDRVIVVGNNTSGPFVARFLSDGTPDPTFGMGGMINVFLGNLAAIQSVTVGAAGRIIVGGYREAQPVKGFVAKVWN